MLIDRHPSVKQGRVVGLFGGFDLCKNKVCASQIANGESAG